MSLEKLNQKVKKLSVLDIGLIKWSVLFATLIIAKLFPVVLNISYPILITLLVLSIIKPLYVFWFKK